MTELDEPFRVRSLTSSVYVPNFLFAVGQGAVIPVIALLALDRGASVAVAGIVVGLRGFGMMLFDIPAGVVVERLGDRRAMTAASVTLALIALGISLRPPLLVFAALIVLMGCAWSVWSLARLSYATEVSPLAHRGRVMSMMGGVNRGGMFLGPILGGLTIAVAGLTGPFVLQAILTASASATLNLAGPLKGERSERAAAGSYSLRSILEEHGSTLRTAGVVVIVMQILRTSKQAIIPLWGNEIGVGPSEISLIFSVSALMEILIFYPVGVLMDRRGRKWALVPSISLLSLGIAAIPLARDLTTFMLIAAGIGLANGMGAGTNMTLGSDLSPSVGRSQFLGVWRFVSDVGSTGGPLLVAAVTSAASLTASAIAVGGAGVVGLLVLVKRVPETLTSR